MLQPKRTKYRREQKNVMKGMAQRGNQLAFGSFGIKTLENCWLTAQQIEAARQAITRYMSREGQLWIRTKNPKYPQADKAPLSQAFLYS
jgi:large subunit ribosomal protein L16